VFDNSISGGDTPSWDGIWTGIRPVEFTKININGSERIFCLSLDYDGVNRVWELFVESRSDNGYPITSFIQTSDYTCGNVEKKQFKYTELLLDEIASPSDILIKYRCGVRAQYLPCGVKHIEVNTTAIDSSNIFNSGDYITEYVNQSRRIKSEQIYGQTGNCVENAEPTNIGRSFSALIIWSGILGIRGLRLFYDPLPDSIDIYNGECAINESGEKILTNYGGYTETPTIEQENVYTSTQSVTLKDVKNPLKKYTGTASDESIISQLDADAKAYAKALIEANKEYVNA
jgi:hypothetical protein